MLRRLRRHQDEDLRLGIDSSDCIVQLLQAKILVARLPGENPAPCERIAQIVFQNHPTGAIAMIVDRFARETIDGLEAEADAEPARQELS